MTTTASGAARSSSSTRSPCSSTPIGTGSRPALVDDLAIVDVARILHRDPRRAPLRKGTADEVQPLRVAERDDHALGLGHDAADAPEVVGERGAERVRAARIAVAELGVGHLRERRHAGSGATPLAGNAERSDGSGESRNAAGAGAAADRRRRARRARVLRDERASALPEVQVPLGRELGVRLDDDSSRHTKLDGEVARGRQLRPAAQRAVADRAPS